MENSKTTVKKPGKKKLIVIISVVTVIAVMLTVVYVRVNPRWRPAELTVEQSDRKTDMKYIDPNGTTVQTRIVTPEGYERVPADSGSFAEYLREYKLLPDGSKLPVYDGTTIDSEYAAAVFDISLGDDGYQQCADTVIRLYSDYFYEKGQYDKISFQFSNGDVCDYEHWRKGKRMLVLGNFSLEIPAAFPDDSEQQYRNYLKEVMNYAGTLSLMKESERISPDELRIGDIICNDSHVVMIVDMAVNEKGEKCYLIGQSFIPAVCFHIVADVNGKEASPCISQKKLEKEVFTVGGYSFRKSDMRRWKDGF